jgi:hypothetical protein
MSRNKYRALREGLDRISLVMIRSNSVEEELQRRPRDFNKTGQAQAELKERMIKLYSGIIEFQAQAVYYFFRKSGGQILHDIIKADD